MGEIARNQFLDFFQVPEASLLSMIRRENQIFSEQTLPALMVLNDPADHIKQKIFFFLENYRVNILGFQLVLKLITIYLHNINSFE